MEFTDKINYLSSERTMRFAAAELARYLGRMRGAPVKVSRAAAYGAAASGWWLGLAGDLPPASAGRVCGSDNDAIFIRSHNRQVVLAGSNGRAVLFAVYRYLEELGCCWIRPGRDGERVPTLADPLATPVNLHEVAAARHRCVCIEGACSTQHVADMIDYAAKRGFNAYFFQFRSSYPFYERWYGLERNRRPRRTPFTYAQAQACQEAGKRAAVRRGMELHVMGHGWTSEPFGLRGEEWRARGQQAPPSMLPLLAQVNGQRALWRGVPLTTQLCYARDDVREAMAAAVLAYVREHPREAVVYVCFADGANNYCECDACRGNRPADWYVRLLNRVDALLTDAGLPARIAFSVYVDLMWPPRRERFKSPERFIMVFSPYTRSYATSFYEAGKHGAGRVAPFKLNKLRFPTDPADNIAMLAKWRKVFAGEAVLFDYHLWQAQYGDPGQMALAKVLHRDALGLRAMGMDGFVSCQCQRIAFPTNIYMEALGRALWGGTETFDQIAERHFNQMYGVAGALVRHYLEGISKTLGEALLTMPKTADDHAGRARMARQSHAWQAACRLPTTLRRHLDEGVRDADRLNAAIWRTFKHYAWFIELFAKFHALAWRGDSAATQVCDTIAAGLDRRLPQLHRYLDTWMCKRLMQHTLWINGLDFTERTDLPQGVIYDNNHSS